MSDNKHAGVDSILFSARIIGAALPIGVAIFLMVALFLRQGKAADKNLIFVYVGISAAVAAVAAPGQTD